MSKPRYYPPPRAFTNEEFEVIRVYVPASLKKILFAESAKRALPLSRLVCIALDNELDVQEPFFYSTEIPDKPYVPYAYADEAGKIARYLKKFPHGLGLDLLLLSRRDIGIFSRSEFLLAYRELLENGVIEEVRPTKAKFEYGSGYKVTRIKRNEEPVPKNRYKGAKKLEGEEGP